MSQQSMKIQWRGPYEWPQLRVPSPLDKMSGVYLWTVESETGYVCTGCGITERTIRQRVMEHRRSYLRGAYTLLDLHSLRQGIRKEIWHGLWAGYNSDKRKAEFVRRKDELQNVANEQMSALKIFVAKINKKRLQQRIEAAIVQTLYEAEQPYCDLPDRGTLRMPRRESEASLTFINESDHHFVNLATEMLS